MLSINYALFLMVIFLAHIMHGVTGFAGTLLAMPLSLMLVGYPVAKPILNILGLLSGIYVFLGNRQYVVWKELWKIVVIMGCGILAGIAIKDQLLGKEKLLYIVLGIFVVGVSLHGLWNEMRKGKDLSTHDSSEIKNPGSEINHDDIKRDTMNLKGTGKVEISGNESDSNAFPKALYLTLPVAGIIHGIFVSGGPLLISYLTKKIPDKNQFRSTISTVWIFLNGMVLIDDIRSGYWNMSLLISTLIAAPFLFGGLKIGAMLYQKMSQHTFMLLSYILLLIMGVKLFI